MKKLRRSRSDRKVLGVCGGIGQYLNVNATIIRVLFFVAILISTHLTFGTAILIYFALALLIPLEERQHDYYQYYYTSNQSSHSTGKTRKDVTPK